MGRRPWLIVLIFATGAAIATALLGVIVPAWYHPRDVALSVLIAVLIALGLVLVARERGRSRAAAIDHTGSIAALRRKTWGEFEILVGEAVRRNGYVVKQRGGFQRDRGMDLIAEQGHERVIIQCKHWLRWKVHEDALKILYADMTTQGFTEGWLVTCGRFTDYAVAWAKGKPIRLINGADLVQLIGQQSHSIPSLSNDGGAIQQPAAGPTCPNCGSRLDRLTNSFDHTMFWGCSTATCRWTFDDASAYDSRPRCGRGHSMLAAKTERGFDYWRCSDSRCNRRRLVASNPIAG